MTTRKLRPWVKVTLVVLAMVVSLFLLTSLFKVESEGEMAERRSKECAAEGYNGILLRHTKEGDPYFICIHYHEK